MINYAPYTEETLKNVIADRIGGPLAMRGVVRRVLSLPSLWSAASQDTSPGLTTVPAGSTRLCVLGHNHGAGLDYRKLAVSSDAIWPPGSHARATRSLELGMALGHQSEAAGWGVQRWLNGGIHSGNLQQLLRESGAPDYIFHLAGGSSVGAAIASPHEDFNRTVATTAELLDWMRLDARNTRLVAISSAAVYGAGHAGPIGNSRQALPFRPYGYHKLMMEHLCQSYACKLWPIGYGRTPILCIWQFLEKTAVVGYVRQAHIRHTPVGAGGHG